MNNFKFTSKDIEDEIKREIYISKYFKFLKNTIYTLIIIASIGLLIATLMFPVLEVASSSMSPFLNNGDIIITHKTKKIKRGDVIAFYHGNKILIKRVIAKSGEWVSINNDGIVYIDGIAIKEDYINKKAFKDSDIEYPYQVKNEEWFVLSDNRENNIDSRNKEVGCISYENIIGKVLFKIWPLN